MAESVMQTLEVRNEFIGHLEEEIKNTNKQLEEVTKQRDNLQETIADLKNLGKYPEHTSLIPLAKNIYMKGKIVHTGECYVKNSATPESYIVLKSLEQTLHSLEDKVNLKKKDIDNVEYAKYQLEERIQLLKGEKEAGISKDKDELPEEIKSEKGVAIKVGELYEILEFEEK